MKDKIFGVLQYVGRSFMLPIAILPVAGLLLGIGGSFSNETRLETYGLLDVMGPGTVFNGIFKIMSEAGDIVFANLPIIFAMGVAIGMARKEKDVAALSAVVAFFIMHASIGALININGGPENMLDSQSGAGQDKILILHAGKHDYRYVRHIIHPTYFLQGFNTVLLLHLNVRQNQVRLLQFQILQSTYS